MSAAPTPERRRQERETFEQLKAQSARWFSLRLSMCYMIVGTLVVIAAVGIWVVLNPARYSATTVALAATALFTDTLGLTITIFRLVLRPGATSP
jgi:hypothetical protein